MILKCLIFTIVDEIFPPSMLLFFYFVMLDYKFIDGGVVACVWKSFFLEFKQILRKISVGRNLQ